MTTTICGLDCASCAMKENCGGCKATNGKPLGGECLLAGCCQKKGHAHCGECTDVSCGLKGKLIAQINALGIDDMEAVTDLYALNGAFVNLEYTLPGGQAVRFWADNSIYLGNQVRKMGSDRCYGITADEHYLLVCEYGENGTDPKIVIYKRWN